MSLLSATDLAKAKSCVKKCRQDFLYHAFNFLKIQTLKGGRIENLKFHEAQDILHEIVEDYIIGKGRRVRVVALKARRMGFSTYWSGRFYNKCAFKKNRYAAQITHEPEATDTLFKMVKRFWNMSPEWLRPTQKYNNARLLEFDTKDGKGLQSAFRVATAGKEDYGSGQAIHYLHLSEVSKWPANTADNLLTSVLQCVPDEDDTEICFESTAKGVGGVFHKRFWAAKYRVWVTMLHPITGDPVIEDSVNPDADEDNDYTSVFLPWFVFRDYRVPPPKGFKKTKEETEIANRYNLGDDQMFWRRLIIANKCNGDETIFCQEYPANPQEAFLTTGRPVFDNVKIEALKNAAQDPIVRYELEYAIDGSATFAPNPLGRLKVWEQPRVGESYIVGADVAEGLAHGDFSYATIINHRTGVQVAEWHGKCDPDQFARLLAALGYKYNTALLGPERNNHGLLVVSLLQGELRYPANRLYVEHIPEPPGKPRPRYGWLTNSLTRPYIIDNLKREVREGTHGIRSKEVFTEMQFFKTQDNGRDEADPGQWDDRVMGTAIAKHLRQKCPIPMPPAPPKQRSGTTFKGRGPKRKW